MKKMFFVILLGLASSLISRPSSYPFIAGDTFRAFCDHIFDETTGSIDIKKIKDGDIVFVNSDMFEQFFRYIHPYIPTQYIIVSHNSDTNTPGRYKLYLDDPKIIAWFAQNAGIKHPKLIPIPIGIANAHWPHGNTDNFKSATQQIIPLNKRSREKKLVYVNFNVETNRVVRAPIWDFFVKQPFSYVAQVKPHREFLHELGQYRFAACPPGGGEDCHRTWESLLLGTIPLVKHSAMDPFFEGLPVVLINDWKEITEDFLLKKFQEISSQTYTMEKVYADYWFNLIRSYQKKHRIKRFIVEEGHAFL